MGKIFRKISLGSLVPFLIIILILIFSIDLYADDFARDLKSTFKTGAKAIYQETGKIPYLGSSLQVGEKAMYDMGKFSYDNNNNAVKALTGYKAEHWANVINSAPKETTGYSLKGHTIRMLYDIKDGIEVAKFQMGQFGKALSDLNPFGQPKVYYNRSNNQSFNNSPVKTITNQSPNNPAIDGAGNRGLRRHRQNL